MNYTLKRFDLWPVFFTIIALASSYFFFQELISPDWLAWMVAPIVVIAFFAGVSATDEDGLARSALYNAALLLIPFMALYSILDELFRADWPELTVAPILSIILWLGIALTAVESDD